MESWDAYRRGLKKVGTLDINQFGILGVPLKKMDLNKRIIREGLFNLNKLFFRHFQKVVYLHPHEFMTVLVVAMIMERLLVGIDASVNFKKIMQGF